MVDLCVGTGTPLAPDLSPVLSAARALGVARVELREDLSAPAPRALEAMRRQLILANVRVALLASTVPADGPGGVAAYRTILRQAALLGADLVAVPAGALGRPDAAGAAAADALRAVCRMGRALGIRVCLENAAAGPLATAAGLEAAFAALAPEAPGWILDPRAFAAQRAHPFFHAFYHSHLKNAVAALRVRDGLFGSGTPALPGQGDAEVKELASILLARSFRGPFLFTPDGPGADAAGLGEAIRAFQGMLLSM
jgi:sugar phosphate isomerase/epimerase